MEAVGSATSRRLPPAKPVVAASCSHMQRQPGASLQVTTPKRPYVLKAATFLNSLRLVSKYSHTRYPLLKFGTHGTPSASPRSALALERFRILATALAVLHHYGAPTRGTLPDTFHPAPGRGYGRCAGSAPANSGCGDARHRSPAAVVRGMVAWATAGSRSRRPCFMGGPEAFLVVLKASRGETTPAQYPSA
jgi:hypothetical protein